MNTNVILEDLEKLDKNFNVIVNDIESIKNVDEEQAKIIKDVVEQITAIKKELKDVDEASESVDDLLFEGIYNLTKKIEALVDIESFEREVKKIKKVEGHLASIIAQSDVVKALEEAFKADMIEDEKDRAETNKKIATVKGDIDILKNEDRLTNKRVVENTAEIRDLKYKDKETDCKIKDLDDKIEKAKLGNAKIDSEQSKHITKNTETIASLDKRIIEVNKRVDGAISCISMLNSEVEKYFKVNSLSEILLGLGIEIVRFGVYFGLAALILDLVK